MIVWIPVQVLLRGLATWNDRLQCDQPIVFDEWHEVYVIVTHTLAAALLCPFLRPRNQRCLCNVVRHRNAHAAEELNALSGVDRFVLFVAVLIEQEMQLIERGAGGLPMMCLVQIAKRYRIGQQLIQITS
jgi:hypothetical protein